MDEFEIEIADVDPLDEGLNEGDDDGSVARFAWVSHAPGISPLAARRPHREQVSRSLTVTAVVFLAVVLLFGNVPNAGASLGVLAHLPTPTPPAPLGVGADTFYLAHAVPWGKPLVDGHSLSVIQTAFPAGAFILPRARHTFEYIAPPFPTLRCQMSVPAARGDTCPLTNSSAIGYEVIAAQARVIDLRAEPERLPPAQRTALEAAVHATLDVPPNPVTVLPGEQYMTTTGVVTAGQPLMATLVFALARDPSVQCAEPAYCGDCPYLCAQFGFNSGTDAWLIAAHVRQEWRYTTTDGSQLVGEGSLLPASAGSGAQLSPLALVEVTWQGHWQVSVSSLSGLLVQGGIFNPTCVAAEIALGSVVQGENSGGEDAVSETNPAAGCLLSLRPNVAAGQSGAPLRYLYRFGVLRAVDSAAQQQAPGLPLADADEQALAKQLVSAAAGVG